MKLICKPAKPVFDYSQIFCSFRTSKAYLWGLINSLLVDYLDTSSSSNLTVLDAACHSLITRDMFPDGFKYYGLDVSSKRLFTALKIKRPSDVLLRADLTRQFSLHHCFDVVVSCNTLSHLPFAQQHSALRNLLSLISSHGKLFVNLPIDEHMMSHCSLLLSSFESVEVIYFDSIRSSESELASNINSSNVSRLLVHNEFNLPNQACLHRQVLFICNNLLSDLSSSLPDFNPRSITSVTTLPSVSLMKFHDDIALLNSLSSSIPILLISSKLYESAYFTSLRSLIDQYDFQCDILNSSSFNCDGPVAILGLENEWSADLALDRTYVNLLREVPDLNIILTYVSRRDALACTPSVVLSDS